MRKSAIIGNGRLETRNDNLETQSSSRGIFAATPIVIAGIAISLANVGSTVIVARLLVPREYGALTQLLGLFFILSMPGSALMVGVVQRVVHWNTSGERWRIRPWLVRIELICFVFLAVFMVAIWLLQGDVARALSLPNSRGVFETLAAGALWVIVSVNRGALQAGKRYRWLGWNLALEGIVRTAFMIGLAAIGLGILGASSGIMIGEAVALVHGIAGVSFSLRDARHGNQSMNNDGWAPVEASHDENGIGGLEGGGLVPADVLPNENGVEGSRDDGVGNSMGSRAGDAEGGMVNDRGDSTQGALPEGTPGGSKDNTQGALPEGTPGGSKDNTQGALPEERPRGSNNDTQGALPKGNGKPNVHGKRELAGDVITAFASLGLIAILEYADVVMVGAYSPSHAGAYGAVSVSAKSLIAWTVLLTNYLLPEAAIRWRLGGHAISELRNTMLLVLLPALLMFVIALSVPSLFLGLAFGNRLEGAASSFPYLTAAMAFLSITVVLSSYFFGVSWRGIPAVLMVGATVLVIAITAVQGRALQTALVDLLVQSGIAVAMVVAFVVVHRRKSKVRSSPLLTGESGTIQATQLITGK